MNWFEFWLTENMLSCTLGQSRDIWKKIIVYLCCLLIERGKTRAHGTLSTWPVASLLHSLNQNWGTPNALATSSPLLCAWMHQLEARRCVWTTTVTDIKCHPSPDWWKKKKHNWMYLAQQVYLVWMLPVRKSTGACGLCMSDNTDDPFLDASLGIIFRHYGSFPCHLKSGKYCGGGNVLGSRTNNPAHSSSCAEEVIKWARHLTIDSACSRPSQLRLSVTSVFGFSLKDGWAYTVHTVPLNAQISELFDSFWKCEVLELCRRSRERGVIGISWLIMEDQLHFGLFRKVKSRVANTLKLFFYHH